LNSIRNVKIEEGVLKVLLTARWPVGGIKTFLRYIYSNDAFLHTNLTLIAPNEGLSEYLINYLPQGRVTFIPCEQSGGSLHKCIKSEISSAKKTNEPYELIHSHGFTAAFWTLLANLGSSTPHLMTAHDVFTERQFMGFKGLVKKTGLSFLFRQLDAIHTVTEDAKVNFLHYMKSVKSQNVHGIMHGVDTEFFRVSSKRNFQEELGLSSDTYLFGFFGRFMAQKGFRNIVKAVESMKAAGLSSHDFRVLTFANQGFIREDYEFIRSRGVSDYFEKLTPTDNMPASIKGIDCVLMPSRWEACGLLAMEVLAAGRPIISSNCNGLREVVADSPAYVVEPENPHMLSDAMRQALQSNPHKFSDFQSTACERFAIKRPANSLAELYASLINTQ
jgi:glycosyltransferase involved in cell wall biosynthesis